MPRGFYQRPTFEERFNKYHTKESQDDCWIWTGAKTKDGYGKIQVGPKLLLAHRLSLEIYLGRPITEGMFVLHSCDNPSCINPKHLREGTNQDNVCDMTSRGRHVGNKKLTWDQVADIRSRVGQSGVSLAAEFGVTTANISQILKGRTWIERCHSTLS